MELLIIFFLYKLYAHIKNYTQTFNNKFSNMELLVILFLCKLYAHININKENLIKGAHPDVLNQVYICFVQFLR